MLPRKGGFISNIGKSVPKVKKWGGYVILAEGLEKVTSGVRSLQDGEGYIDRIMKGSYTPDSSKSLWTTWLWAQSSWQILNTRDIVRFALQNNCIVQQGETVAPP